MRLAGLRQVSSVAVLTVSVALTFPASIDAQVTDPAVKKSLEQADWRKLPSEQLKELCSY